MNGTREDLAHRLENVLRDYYPDGVEKRLTVAYHLADEAMEAMLAAPGGVTVNRPRHG